jgi:hypothetical protein
MVLLQLNLFFILLLHHNEFSESLLSLCAPAQTAPNLKTETPPRPQHLCPACQIARQGAVFPFAVPSVRPRLARVQRAAPAGALLNPFDAYLRLSGRDPPRS